MAFYKFQKDFSCIQLYNFNHSHSYKFAAELQHKQTGEHPALIRIETRAGHGGGMPVSMRMDQIADKWAFLVRALGMETEAERATRDPAPAPTEPGPTAPQ